MVVVEVRGDEEDRARGERPDDGTQVPHAGPGVEEDGTLAADDQVAEVLLVVAGLADREGSGRDLLDGEPIVGPANRGALVLLRARRRCLLQRDCLDHQKMPMVGDHREHETEGGEPHEKRANPTSVAHSSRSP